MCSFAYSSWEIEDPVNFPLTVRFRTRSLWRSSFYSTTFTGVPSIFLFGDGTSSGISTAINYQRTVVFGNAADDITEYLYEYVHTYSTAGT